jgi:BlaI family transcriptional regulator, penicillinase repressor
MRLGKLQYTILQTLHRYGPMTARALTDTLSADAPVAHSTVQTLLRQLEGKGLVAHEQSERTFIFRALRDPDDLGASPLRDLLERVYSGSVYGMMSHLLQQERITPEERERLRQLLEGTEDK